VFIVAVLFLGWVCSAPPFNRWRRWSLPNYEGMNTGGLFRDPRAKKRNGKP
jgi:hypothetical protein